MSTHILDEPAPAGQPGAQPHRRRPPLARAVRAFRTWRKGRPFAGGLLAVLAGAELLAAPLAPLGVVIHQGVAGFSAAFFGPLLMLFGFCIWFAPHYKLFSGVCSILIGLIVLPTVNLGGFFIGTILALTGGMLATAWMPVPGWTAPTRGERRRARRLGAMSVTAAEAEAGAPAEAQAEAFEIPEAAEGGEAIEVIETRAAVEAESESPTRSASSAGSAPAVRAEPSEAPDDQSAQ